ncbi:MAG: hypothetical protein GY679_01535 [Mycoplasma sp.]|nr:hypothetical protein [Mycoplasma sp.]
MKADFYCSDDYVTLVTNKYSFYYGYEYIYCEKEKRVMDCRYHSDDCDCEQEWSFVVEDRSKNDEIIFSLPASKLNNNKEDESKYPNIHASFAYGITLFYEEMRG